MSTETDQDLTVIEHLDFRSDLECAIENCENIATWMRTIKCCASSASICSECRARKFEEWRENPSRVCMTCHFEWDARKTINVDWTRL